MYTIVCPLSIKFSPKSFQQFIDIGLLSYDKFLNLKDLESFIIVCPEDEIKELEKLRILFPEIPFLFFSEEKILNCDFSKMRGWIKQQIIKLKISSYVKTEIYIPIDGDLFLVDYLNEENLKKDGKFKISFEPYQTINDHKYSVNSAWVNGSEKLLNYKLENEKIMSVTPQIMITDIVINLMLQLPSNWENLFFIYGATEYTLYWLFVLKNKLEEKYIDCTSTKPLWYHDLEVNVLVRLNSKDIVERVTRSLSEKRSFFGVIQSWMNLDTSCLQDVFHSFYDDSKKEQYKTLRENLKVYGCKYKKIRSGNKHDGGYVYVDFFKNVKIDALYAYGVGDNINFEIDFLNKHDPSLKCYLYDHTVILQNLPGNIKFFKEGISWAKYNDLNTIENQVVNNGHLHNKNLFMKMDIEGHEFQSIVTTPDHILENFTQIILEVHWLNTNKTATLFQKIEFFKKMNKIFYLVHVHANNCSKVFNCPDGINLPDVLELSFVRKDLIEPYTSVTSFPTELDTPNNWRFPDIKFDFPPFDIKFKNIIIICSIIHGSPNSKFSGKERLEQTVKVLENIRKRIPDSYIIFNEISNLTKDEKSKLDYDVFFSHQDFFVKSGFISENKTMGELFLIINGLEWIKENLSNVNYDRIFKIGGRVCLTENFNLENYKIDKVNFKINPSKKDDVFTTMFSFGKNHLDMMLSLFQTAYNTRCLDRYIENGLFQMVSRLKDFNNISTLGMKTNFSITGIESIE